MVDECIEKIDEALPIARSLIAELAELREKLKVAEQIYQFASDILYPNESVAPNSWYKQTDKVYGTVLSELYARLIEQKERTK